MEDKVIPQIIPKGMRLIEGLRNDERFANSTFWIIGSDPNLEFYPDNFFDDKFAIAVNTSCIAFPRSTFFSMGSKDIIAWMVKHHCGCLKKTILLLEHIGQNQIGRWEDWGLEPIYIIPENKPLTASIPDYESTAKRISGHEFGGFVLTRTTVHYAVFAAVVFGAKKIVLVGCSHKASRNKAYAQTRGMAEFIGKDVEEISRKLYYGSKSVEIGRLRRDTIRLTETFRKYDVEITRHRWDEKRKEFRFDIIGAIC